jgi:hypothetical protein
MMHGQKNIKLANILYQMQHQPLLRRVFQQAKGKFLLSTRHERT